MSQEQKEVVKIIIIKQRRLVLTRPMYIVDCIDLNRLHGFSDSHIVALHQSEEFRVRETQGKENIILVFRERIEAM